MVITNSIQMDLKNRGVAPVVYAVQNEAFSRAIELVLKDGGRSWSVPAGTTAAIRFRKSDGKGGVYDTLPGGSIAYNISGNKVTFYLAPQVLTSDGIATVQLVLMKQKDVLCSFGIHINVESDVSIGEPGSEDYFNLKDVMLEQIENYFATHPDAGLSMLLLPNINGDGVVSHDVYISDFQIPTGFVPKSGDLVLHSDGYLGYIQSVDHEIDNTASVVMFSPPISLKGDQSIMVVHIDDSNDEITADKTHAEILSAIQNGRLVMGVYKDEKSVCSGPFDPPQYLRFDPVYVSNARMPHKYFSVNNSNIWTTGNATAPTDEHINDLINEAVPVSEKPMLVRFNTQPGNPNCNKTYDEISRALIKQRPVFAFRGNDSTGEMYIAVLVTGAINFYPFYTGNGDGDRMVYSFIQITDDDEVIMGERIQPNTKNEVFIAEYGVTTREEILAAYNAGKACFAKWGDGGNLYSLTATANPGGCVFSGVTASNIVVLRLAPANDGGNEWTHETYPLYVDEDIIELIQDNAPESIPQTDWNQSDSEAKDYLKNKPFYEALEETTVTREFDGESKLFDPDFCELLFEKRSEAVHIVEGTGFSYVGNDSEWSGGWSYSISDGVSTYYVIAMEGSGSSDVDGLVIMTAGGTFKPGSISVTAEAMVVHPLDEKYIPETIARKTDIPSVSASPVVWVNATLNEEIVTADRDFNYLMANFADKAIMCRLSDDDNNRWLLLCNYYASNGSFFDFSPICVGDLLSGVFPGIRCRPDGWTYYEVHPVG